jgi:predicted Zn-dependent protease
VIAVAALVLIGAWAIWQPLRAADADSAALNALVRGDTRTAYSDATAAKGYDPVSADPLLTLSAVYTAAGDPARARAELLSAVSLQPDNPDMWQALGDYDRGHRRPRAALAELKRALALDPGSPAVQADVVAATTAQ